MASPPADPPSSPLGSVLADMSPAGQALVPGVYAWLVTVAPFAFGRGGSGIARAAAIGSLFALGAAVPLDRGRPRLARGVSVWGFTVGCAIAWLASGAAAGAVRLEPARAVAGMAGWALFALASAAPAPRRDTGAGDRIVIGGALRPRARVGSVDMAIVVVGVALAGALQAFGWDAPTPERLLLGRLLALVAGVALIGASTRVALARHAPPSQSSRRRLQAAAPWVATLFVLLAFALARCAMP